MTDGSQERRIVLVTGTPRSGTTVVGDILGSARRNASLYEPMNIQSGDRRFDVAFPIPGPQGFTPAALEAFIEDLKALRLDPRSGVFPHERGLAALGKWLVGGRTRASLRAARARPWIDTLIWKDPFAMLCVPDLLAMGVPVVVTWRPAAAIAASFKRLNWSFDIDAIADRVATVIHRPMPLPLEGGPRVAREVECAVYLWKLCLALCLTNEGSRPILVSTGDLNRNPTKAFEVIFARLGLRLDDAARREIDKRFTDKRGAAAVPEGHPHTRDRDFTQANLYWKQLLSPAEADFVEKETAELERAIANQIQRPTLIPDKVA